MEAGFDDDRVAVADPSVINAVYEASRCPDNVSVEFFSLSDTFGSVDEWLEVLEAPSDVFGGERAPDGTFIAASGEFVTRSISDGSIESVARDMSTEWTREALAATIDPAATVYVGWGARPNSERPASMLAVLAVGERDGVAFVGECRSTTTDTFIEILGEPNTEVVRALLALPSDEAQSRLVAAAAGDAVPPVTAPPQLLPGLSEVDGLDPDDLEEFIITVEVDPALVEANPGRIVCIATSRYLGTCAELGAFSKSDRVGDTLEFDLSIQAAPGDPLKLVEIFDDDPDKTTDIADVPVGTTRMTLSPVGSSLRAEESPVRGETDPTP